MRRFMQKIQTCIQDNRGLTLIELMIAVVILGFVSTPLLHSFLTSANTEVKARKMGEANLVAQNIMECIEANELEAVIPESAGNLAGLLGAGSASYYIYSDAGYTEYGSSRPESVTDAAGNTSDPKDYHIGVGGVSAGGQSYYAMIDFNAAPGDADAANIVAINEVAMSEYSPMDVVFQVPANEIGIRTITLDVAAGENAGETNVTLQYVIAPETEPETVDDDESGAEGDDESGAEDEDQSGGATEANNKIISYSKSYTVETAKLSESSIYVFYYPDYDNGDTIVINNLDNLEFNLFLVKRMDSSIESLTDLDNLEMSYVCTVEQYVGDLSKDVAAVYSNVEERLSYTAGHRTSESDDEIRDFSYTITNGIRSESGEAYKMALVSEGQQDRIYEVTVKIYDASFSGDALCTISGTKLK